MTNGIQPWMNAPEFTQIAASQQGGSRGAQFWGVQIDNQLNTIYQESPGGTWAGWMGDPWQGTPPVFDLAACQQSEGGPVALFVLDIKQQLWMIQQTSPGGDWTGWSGPNWNGAQQLQDICASLQGGSRGAQLWGIQEDYSLVTCFQETPDGDWSSWEPWPTATGDPTITQIAAALQND